jgi:PS-10 peptidase S37
MNIRRWRISALLSAVLVAAGEPISAGRLDPPGHEDGNRCLNEFGIDLNQLYGVTAQMQTGGCRLQTAGEQWVVPLWWIVHTGDGSVYPPGYTPSSPLPIQDFTSKLVAVKIVVDAGLPSEKTHYLAAADVLRTDIDTGALYPGGFDQTYPVASILPLLLPLSVGAHTYQPFLLMRAQHCDGFEIVVRNSCLPAGEVPFGPRRTLTVTAPLTSPGGDIRDRLERIPGLTVVDDVPLESGDRFFRLIFDQPIDHRDPALGSFGQRLTLLHTDKTRPMVLHTTGYGLLDFPFLTETTRLVGGNQISVEERYFFPSQPQPPDWSKLTIWQAAADHHRIVEAFKSTYTRRWLSTGSSKGGMASVYHRRFFPDDVSGTIVFGAPNDVDDAEDSAYSNFFLQVGTDPGCRVALTRVQNEALGLRRGSLQTALAGFEAAGLTFDQTLGSPDRALEVAVTELPFLFWQFYGQWLCPAIPLPSATDGEIIEFIDAVVGLVSYTDQFIAPFIPYYVQAGTELGFPSPDTGQLGGLRYPGIDAPRSFVPAAIPLIFDPAAMADIDTWVRTAGTRLLVAYGERDPWSAEPFRLGPGSRDSFSFTAPRANHLLTLNQLAPADQQSAVATILRWASVSAKTRPERRVISGEPLVRRGRALPAVVGR